MVTVKGEGGQQRTCINSPQCYYRCGSNLVTIAKVSKLEADMKIIAEFRESNKPIKNSACLMTVHMAEKAGGMRNIKELIFCSYPVHYFRKQSNKCTNIY